jgi:hypothetical protein
MAALRVRGQSTGKPKTQCSFNLKQRSEWITDRKTSPKYSTDISFPQGYEIAEKSNGSKLNRRSIYENAAPKKGNSQPEGP